MRTRLAVKRKPRTGAELIAKSPRLQRIIAELEALFFKEGFLHFRTEELARRLRCSKQTLYTLAPRREELFDLVVERLLSAIRNEAQEAAAKTQDRTAALTGFLEAVGKGLSKVSDRFVEDLGEFPQGQERLKQHQEVLTAMLAELISAGAREGAFQAVHPSLDAEVLIRAAATIAEPDFLSRTGLTLSQALGELHNLYLHGLLRPESRSEPKDQDAGQNRQRGMNVFAFR